MWQIILSAFYLIPNQSIYKVRLANNQSCLNNWSKTTTKRCFNLEVQIPKWQNWNKYKTIKIELICVLWSSAPHPQPSPWRQKKISYPELHPFPTHPTLHRSPGRSRPVAIFKGDQHYQGSFYSEPTAFAWRERCVWYKHVKHTDRYITLEFTTSCSREEQVQHCFSSKVGKERKIELDIYSAKK